MSDDGIVSMDTMYMKSRIVNHGRKLEWSVTNFSKYPPMCSIPSKVFKLAANCPFEFVIEIALSVETFRILIRRIDKVNTVFPVSGTLSFQNSDGEIFDKVLNSIYVFGNVYDRLENTEIWSSNRPGRTALEMVNFPLTLPNDEVTIKCHIIVSNCCIITEEVGGTTLQNSPGDASLSRDLFQDLRTMYLEKPMTDILLKVGSDFFPCHKFILCARSPVFRKMLEDDPNVQKFGIVAIEDMDLAVLDVFLEYLYTNSLCGYCPDVLLGLYNVSIKYEMSGMRDKCSELLAKNLSERIACKAFKLADVNNDANLKEASSAFITENFYKLKDTQEFIAFVDSNPRLFFQIISNSFGKVLPNS